MLNRLVVLLLFVQFSFGQNTFLYKNLYVDMSKKDLRKEIKDNREKYSFLELENDNLWKVDISTAYFEKNKLKALLFYPRGTKRSGLGYEKTKSYLENASNFFINEANYKEFYRTKFWNNPQSFSHYYGLVLISPDDKKVIHLRPLDYMNKNSNAVFFIVDYDRFMKTWKTRDKKKQFKNDNNTVIELMGL